MVDVADPGKPIGAPITGNGLIALVGLGPGSLVIGWVLLVANAGNGANDIWMLGHYILFIGNAAWVPLVWSMTGQPSTDANKVRDLLPVALALVGSLTVAGQVAIDMVAWALALDGPALSTFFAAIRSKPIVSLTVHTIGPVMLFLGVFLMAARSFRTDHSYRSGSRLIGVGTVLVLIGALSTFSYVTVAGYVVLLVGFIVLTRAMTATL